MNKIPEEKKKYLRYVTKMDRLLNIFLKNSECFHLAIEYPYGKRYFEIKEKNE
jgi:hypothetical protein